MSLFNINTVTLVGGRLTKDAELRFANNGNPRLSFSIAMNEGYKDQSGEWQDKPEYHNIVYWGKYAETIAPNMKKGVKVSITGRLAQHSYEDNNGMKHSVTEVIADKVLYERPTDTPREAQAAPTRSQYSPPPQNYSSNRTSAMDEPPPRSPDRYAQGEMDYSEMTDEDVPF